MGAENVQSRVPRLVVWYGCAIFYFGVLCFPLALVLGIAGYLMEGGDVLSSLLTIFEAGSLAVGICGFGIGVASGIRDFLIGLLIIVAFAGGLIGFLFILGKNPKIGYYLWAIGGFVSISLVVILAGYWKKLPMRSPRDGRN